MIRNTRCWWSPVVWSVIFILSLTEKSWAKPPSEAEFQAAADLALDVEDWLEGLDPKPASIGIFFIRSNPPLEPSYGEIFEKEISRVVTERALKLVLCPECRVPQVEVIEDRLIVKKGAPDLEAMRTLAKKYQVDAFLAIELFRTKVNVVAQAHIYQAATAQVIAAETFKAPALDWSESALQILLTVGPAKGSGQGEGMAANLMILEEIGFGKGGLTLGGGGSGEQSMLYVLPTIGWRGRFRSGTIYSLKSLGIGFGGSGGSKGVAARVAYDLFVGSFTNFGIAVAGFGPISQNDGGGGRGSGFVGVHLGISLGR